LTTDDIIAILEQDDTIIDSSLYIGPPELHELSDGDSGDEWLQSIIYLHGVLAELQARRLTEGGVQDEILGLQEGQE
ncbi:hypothetical protein L9F63_017662, partial [Diploptera punctata]